MTGCGVEPAVEETAAGFDIEHRAELVTRTSRRVLDKVTPITSHLRQTRAAKTHS